MFGIKQAVAGYILLLATAAPVLAANVSVGTISLAADPNLGFYSIRVYNLTGDPAQGGYALPPDYPVLTELWLGGASLTYVTIDKAGNQVARTVELGDIRPGAFTSKDLVFDQSTRFQSITLTAMIQPGTFDTASGKYTSPDQAAVAQLKRQDGKPLHAFDSADVVVRQANPTSSGSLLPRGFGRQPLMTMANCALLKRRETFVP